MRKQFDIHRHIGGLEIMYAIKVWDNHIHRHTGGLEINKKLD